MSSTASGVGRSGQEHRGRADRHREGQAVAEAIGMERLGGGEHDVVRADPQHLGAVGVGGEAQAGMDVPHALRRAGRA